MVIIYHLQVIIEKGKVEKEHLIPLEKEKKEKKGQIF